MKIDTTPNFIPMSSQGFNFHNEEDNQSLEYLIEKKNIGVIIIDSLPATTSYIENQSKGVTDLYVSHLKRIMEKYGLTWILIHHFKKGESHSKKPEKLLNLLRGSVALSYLVDTGIVFIKEKEILNLIICKSRTDGNFFSFA